MKQILAVSIIILFIGVAVAPSINQSVVRASPDDDLVEVTTQACGIKGYGNTTVKLTREQYQDLEQYLVEFRARLNQTTTREEAIPLFKGAVVELNKYGLLPRGMSVDRLQKLVTRFEKSTMAVEKISSFQSNLKYVNLFCLIAGKVDDLFVANSLVTCLADYIIFILLHLPSYSYYFAEFLIFIQLVLLMYKNDLPNRIVTLFNFLSLLTFGGDNYYGPWGSNGWVYSIGLLVIRGCEGSLYGQIPLPVYAGVAGYQGILYTGIFGFTGIRIILEDYSSLFLGTALRVNIGDTPPL